MSARDRITDYKLAACTILQIRMTKYISVDHFGSKLAEDALYATHSFLLAQYLYGPYVNINLASG